jgi:hypothetical protein
MIMTRSDIGTFVPSMLVDCFVIVRHLVHL